MELPPAVVVGVEEKGLGEEEQDVREKGRGEHAHHVVRELRVQDDEHERQRRAERRGQRERDGEELRELVGEPVVSLVSGLVADRLDDEREDGDGQDEGREQQVQLRDHPDRDAAADDGKPSIRRPLRRAWPGQRPCSPASSFSPATPPWRAGAGAACAIVTEAARPGSWNSSFVRAEAVLMAPTNITMAAAGPRRTSSVRFLIPPSTDVRDGGHHREGVPPRGKKRARWLGLRRAAGQSPRARVRNGTCHILFHCSWGLTPLARASRIHARRGPRAPLTEEFVERSARLRQGCGEVSPKRRTLRERREGGNAVSYARESYPRTRIRVKGVSTADRSWTSCIRNFSTRNDARAPRDRAKDGILL